MPGSAQKVYTLYAVFVVAITGFDQLTKWLVLQSETLASGKQIPIIQGFFHLVHVNNPGAAWGIFSGRQTLLAAVSLLVFAGLLIYQRAFTGDWLERQIAVGAILGGILGNFIDRVTQSAGVIDFLRFFYRTSGGRLWEWPSFNVADIAICVGVGLFLVSSFVHPNPKGSEEQGTGGESTGTSTPPDPPTTMDAERRDPQT